MSASLSQIPGGKPGQADRDSPLFGSYPRPG